MGTTFVDITASLDGYVAGPNDGLGRGLGDGGECLHDWIMGGPWTYAGGASFQARPADQELLDESLARLGAVVMGRRVFDVVDGWGDDPPFRVPVYVLTHRAQGTRIRGATTFRFVTDGIDSALEQARADAGTKDVSIMGGANVIQQYLQAGLVDEMTVHVAPVLLGAGTRLFDNIGGAKIALEPTRVRQSPFATHLSYRVLPRPGSTE
jgi:dihydrofolate reductase